MWQIVTSTSGVLLMVREIETVNYVHLVYGKLTFTVTLCMSDNLVITDSLPFLWRANICIATPSLILDNMLINYGQTVSGNACQE